MHGRGRPRFHLPTADLQCHYELRVQVVSTLVTFTNYFVLHLYIYIYIYIMYYYIYSTEHFQLDKYKLRKKVCYVSLKEEIWLSKAIGKEDQRVWYQCGRRTIWKTEEAEAKWDGLTTSSIGKIVNSK